MRSSVVFLGLVATTSIANAQSRADQEPASRPDAQLPVTPAPSDDTRDQPAATYPAPEVVSPPPEPATKLVVSRTANDTLTHHLLLSVGTAYSGLFGSLDSATSLPNRLAGGYSIIVGVGYGLSRYVEVELVGSLDAFGGDTGCPSCKARTYDALGAIRYHLVQGERFDPWVRFGVGSSILRFEDNGAERNTIGFQWLNATVGGDWYMTRTFAFGPFLSLAMTSYLDHPSGTSTSVAFKGLGGINLTFDPSGK